MHSSERLRLFRASALVAGAFLLLVHAASAHSVTPAVVVWSERLERHVLNTAEVTVQAVVEDGQVQRFCIGPAGSYAARPARLAARRRSGPALCWPL